MIIRELKDNEVTVFRDLEVSLDYQVNLEFLAGWETTVSQVGFIFQFESVQCQIILQL